ncbi:hypothetical protein HAALTHF_53210n [Vreelandella aquamarina]|nr:hypothetical protein HAALTHF_53210n [Halomonas axialensis]
MGYGAFAAGAYHAGPVTLRAIVNASEGANSYLYLSGDYFNGADAYVDTNGSCKRYLAIAEPLVFLIKYHHTIH